MTDRPIIFSAQMVRALLDGRKTQTRRVLKPQPDTLNGGTIWAGEPFTERAYNGTWPDGHRSVQSLPYAPGDRLWVREKWAGDARWNEYPPREMHGPICYKASAAEVLPYAIGKWRSPIHMPRWASRLTLTVTDVRVQRVQEISEDDARAEGSKPWTGALQSYRTDFARIWRDIHGPDAWDRNDWVAVLTFTVEQRNIDA